MRGKYAPIQLDFCQHHLTFSHKLTMLLQKMDRFTEEAPATSLSRDITNE
ncbi:hypothetical protein PVA45_08155 (plasmid) [Entomospira entomophila]|uniref:Uncharacterized protein n=1 Tax=Entomospira entomophila TaxID=2719988 RepID=A0A968GA91_9SPIO|nr:hypothetical protein [Entomospira entomophilus]NIZ41478.1 hypothetical protein [Entomospira entomophilus]WDI36312.1 hypothetical protein PVA45_08155 [Entomospira entomophilus]